PFLFVSPRFVPHRALPSFPTRRSSDLDLARRLPGRGVWVDATRQAVAVAVRKGVFARSLKRQVSVSSDLPALVERLMTRRLVDADRKSTRLNSSHEWISYAVFCLKKKQ